MRQILKNSPGDAVDEEDDWLGAMEDLGLTRRFQGRLMAPEAKEMRLMASVKEWTIQMITMRCEFLESLDDVIKTPSRGVDRPAGRITQSGMLGRLDKNKPEIPERGSSAGKPPSEGNFQSGPSVATKAVQPPEGVEDCQMLYKGGAMKRLESIFKANGALDFKEIRSESPTDFSSNIRGLYLTKQAEGAWADAQMTARLVEGLVVPVGILQVAIPNRLLSSAYGLVGQDWRRYVWICRNEEGLPPDDLANVGEFQWVFGPLCKQGQSQINKMKDASELMLWRLKNGQAARQIFTSNLHMINFLSEKFVEKVWVTSLAARNKS